MDKREFATFAAALKTYYPRENLLPNPQAMELWYRQLQDIPCQLAEMALNKWVATNKWPPSIAEIREQASAIKNGEKPLWSDGWEEVLRAISKYGMYGETEALQSMSELTRKAVKRLGFKSICISENIMADRANFRMIFEQLSDRESIAQQLPADLQNLISDFRLKLMEPTERSGDG